MKRPGTLQNALSLLLLVTTPTAAWASDEKQVPTEATPQVDARSDSEKQANDAREREKKSRTSGHNSIADRLAALAKMWLRVAAAERKAAELEQQADAIERETLDLEAQARRGSSLVEQTEARRARALARLQELGLAEEVESQTPPLPAPPAAAPSPPPAAQSPAAVQKPTPSEQGAAK